MPTDPSVEAQQRELAARVGAAFVEAQDGCKIGIADNVRPGAKPIHGLRHPPVGDTSGWYLWAGDGEPEQADDYFKPLHVEHLDERFPGLRRYLGLPPGWRFVTDLEGYEDIWEDRSLLDPGGDFSTR